MKKQTGEVKKKGTGGTIKVGDRVWFRMPHNGTVTKLFWNGVQIEPDEIEEGTVMERFGFDEIDTLTKPK